MNSADSDRLGTGHGWRTLALTACLASMLASSTHAAEAILGPTALSPQMYSSGNPQPTQLPFKPNMTTNRGVGVSVSMPALRWDATGAQTPLEAIGRSTPNSIDTEAYGMNALGTAVGIANKYDPAGSSSSAGSQPVRWDAGSTVPFALGLPDSTASFASNVNAIAVNTSNAAVGYFDRSIASRSLGRHAVRWNAAGVATELGDLEVTASGFANSNASAINASGVAVGSSDYFGNNGRSGRRATRWSATSTVATRLGDLGTYQGGGSATSVAYAINDAGTTVGFATKYAASDGLAIGSRAVRWNANSTTAVELGVLNADTRGSTESQAYAINAAGATVGFAVKYSTAGTNLGPRAVRWNANATLATELGNLGTNSSGSTSSEAFDINASGAVVGYARRYNAAGDAGAIATAWLPGSTVATDLDALKPAGSGWEKLETATDITDTGWVSGTGIHDPDGPLGNAPRRYLAFLMLLPEAGTYGKGDANFDGKTDFGDLVIVAQNYGHANATKATSVGDVNLDGFTDFTDLVALAQNYNTGVAPLGDAAFAGDWARAQSLVPEPAFVAILGTFATATLRVRSRKMAS